MTTSSKILILLVAVTVSASFWAFSQAESHVISACVSPAGIMRLLASGECKNNETLVSWNEQGEQGDTGEQGEQGEQGEAGESGQDGADGTDEQRPTHGDHALTQLFEAYQRRQGSG